MNETLLSQGDEKWLGGKKMFLGSKEWSEETVCWRTWTQEVWNWQQTKNSQYSIFRQLIHNVIINSWAFWYHCFKTSLTDLKLSFWSFPCMLLRYRHLVYSRPGSQPFQTSSAHVSTPKKQLWVFFRRLPDLKLEPRWNKR